MFCNLKNPNTASKHSFYASGGGIGKFGVAPSFTKSDKPVCNRVSNIFLVCYPLKVAYVVVLGIAILVVALKSLGAWANERLCDQSVNKFNLVMVKQQARPAFSVVLNLPYFPNVGKDKAFHPTVIGDFVLPLVSNDGLPYFNCGRIGFRHDLHLVCGLCLETSDGDNHQMSRLFYHISAVEQPLFTNTHTA